MSFSQFLFVLRFRYKLIAMTLFLIVAATVAVSLLISRTYEATATVLVNYKGADPVTGMAIPSQMMPGFMSTQADIITSKNVAKKVISALGLASNENVRQSFVEATDGEGDISDWLAELLIKNLDAVPSKQSSLIDISFKGVSPQFSAAVANAFADAYLQTTIQLKVDPSKKAAEYLDDQIKLFRENVQVAQEKLSAYQQDKGIVSVDNRLDVESARLNELSSQLVMAQAQTMEAQSRERGASGAGLQDSPDIASNPIVQGLKTEIARAEGRFADITQKYEKNHPAYQGAKAEIDNLKAELIRQTRSVSGNVASNSRILKQRENEIRGALASQKTRILEINRERDQLAMLSREVDNAQQIYTTALDRFTTNNLEAQSNMSDVVLLNPATPPLKPSSPNMLLNVLISIFVGGFLGVVLALVAELINRRVRLPEDLVFAARAPVLGELKRMPAGSKLLGFIPKSNLIAKK
ncbi:chain length determinant protein EpsF [Methylobacillus gramineus]|uniref:chain length determinant protein EpsF n=1 Tax=Methylobacillus gramineus TaxID=755169 RepID=UPI001CFFF0FD|nr:chain length determinant protein EpsF [Methylobacillus gramineus]MCB5183685.1 chain length determinant protein EpsF [Methylobacillus gramineus]